MPHNVVLLLLLASPAFSTIFSHCTIGPAPSAVRLEGCEKDCQFSPGDVMQTQVDVKPNKRVTSLKADLYAAETYHLLEDPAGCTHLLSRKCPVNKDVAATYVFNITVFDQLLGKLPIHFTLTDQTVDTVACFDMEVRIVNKTSYDASIE